MTKIVMIAGLAGLAFALAPRFGGASAVSAASAAPAAPTAAAGFAAALIPCFYAYGGYHMTMNLGADVKDARRRFPAAVTAGMLAVVGLYLALNAAYVRTLGVEGVAGSTLVAAALARATFGRAGEAGQAVVSTLIFLSAAGFVNATVLQMPRSTHAMAEDGVLPAAFRRVDPRTQVSRAGLAFFGVTMLVPAFVLGSFEKLLNYIIFTDMVTLVVVASTLFVLRRRGDGDGPGGNAFRVPGYPVLPALYILALAAAAAHVAVTEPALALAGTAILVGGWPLFVLGRKLSGG
jgi:APA family basic amino acid/polyamine antiporter